MDSISFQSRIRPVGINDYYTVSRKISERGNAKPPWTLDESVFNKDVFTSRVIDCTVCGITDGENALLVHICPTVRENRNFLRIENYIRSRLEQMNKEYLQGFLLGSQGEEPRESSILFNKFANLMERLNVPTSIFRSAKEDVNLAYISDKDEWIISTLNMPALLKGKSPEEAIRSLFKEVKISEKDEFVKG